MRSDLLFPICGYYQKTKDFVNIMGKPLYLLTWLGGEHLLVSCGRAPLKDNALCQQALCGPAVFTFTGFVLRTGGEACNNSNHLFVGRTLRSFGFGVRKGVAKEVCKIKTKSGSF